MALRPHADIPDSIDELAQRQAKANARAVERGEQPKTLRAVRLKSEAARLRNDLSDRYVYAVNVLLRLLRGTVDVGGGPLNNGWLDGDFRVAFRIGPNEYRPSSVEEAQSLVDRLKAGLWAAYLYEFVDNVDAVGSEKDRRNVRRPLEEGGFEQIAGRDWTRKDEAAEIFIDQALPEAAFRTYLANIRKPVQQGR